jgi:hypothetical protein
LIRIARIYTRARDNGSVFGWMRRHADGASAGDDDRNATVRPHDTRHFALETHVDEIASGIGALPARAVG